MTLTNAIVVGVATCIVSAGSSVVGGQQSGELSGFREFQVEGHDIVAGIEIRGTKHVDSSKLRERFRSNGAELRLGLPLDSQTLCRFKEVLRDVMHEKGFLDADITHDTRPTYGNRQHLTLTFTIIEGKRSRAVSKTAASLTPAQRCLR